MNLQADPVATVAVGDVEIPVRATLLHGAERERCLQRSLSYPTYRAYLTRTNRDLKLFALSRA